jgi:hypothetical protein
MRLVSAFKVEEVLQRKWREEGERLNRPDAGDDNLEKVKREVYYW